MSYDPDQLRELAERVRAEAADADDGSEESGVIADLFDAAASEDFVLFGDTQRVRSCINRIADVMDRALGEEATR